MQTSASLQECVNQCVFVCACVRACVFVRPSLCFYCTGVEKKNADCKGYYYSSNKHDASKDVLETCERINLLRHADTNSGEPVVRNKRLYRKRRRGQGTPTEPPAQRARVGEQNSRKC